ncbi:MAG: glycosyltransferase [Candidatus Nitrosocosmicus sp.]
MFKHFLVTRFNLRISNWKTTKSGLDVLSETWLNDRFEKFESYCLPSVLNQRNKNFKWLIFFDTLTPAKYLRKIEELQKTNPYMYCYFINGITELSNAFKEAIKTLLDKKNKWVITTRLDNDDAIHENFVQEIQSNFIPQDETVIDARSGLQLNIQKKKAEVRKLHNEFNPFLSLIEKSADFQTVILKPHREWKSPKNLIVLESEPLWIEVVHKNNKLNEADENRLLIKKFNCREYGISNLKFMSDSDIVFQNTNKKLAMFIIQKKKSLKAAAKRILSSK